VACAGHQRHANLDLADQVDGRGQHGCAFVPLGRAYLSGVGSGVLGSFQLTHSFLNVAGDLVGVDFGRLDHQFGIDDEGTAQCQAFFRDVHAESIGQGVGRVANQGELGLADGRGGFVPHLVGEMRVGRHDVDLGTRFLELAVVISRVFDFGRAVEGEGCRHENQDGPLALQRLVAHGNEFAIVEGFGLEGLDLGIDQRHGCIP
jgi:hypothetical protein